MALKNNVILSEARALRAGGQYIVEVPIYLIRSVKIIQQTTHNKHLTRTFAFSMTGYQDRPSPEKPFLIFEIHAGNSFRSPSSR